MDGGSKIKYLNNQLEDVINKKYIVDDNIQNKIMNILDNNNIKLSDSGKYKSESSILKNLSKREPVKEVNGESNNIIDNNVKNIIDRDLGDSDKATTYNAEDNNNYREIFSNSIKNEVKGLESRKAKSEDTEKLVNSKDNADTKDTLEKENFKNKKKFFNNYLQI